MLIGINGFLGSGKDTVYKRMAQLSMDGGYGIDEPVYRISFADKLKLSAAAALGVFPAKKCYACNGDDPHCDVPNEQVIAWVNDLKDNGSITLTIGKKIYVLTGRQYLQWYGTESHRDIFGSDFWVDQALPLGLDIDSGLNVVTDVRFENEIARVKKLGGQIWNIKGVDESMAGSHVSETPIDPALVDVFISNNVRDDNFRYLDDQIVRALNVHYPVR